MALPVQQSPEKVTLFEIAVESYGIHYLRLASASPRALAPPVLVPPALVSAILPNKNQ
jgi:hypothetical protein